MNAYRKEYQQLEQLFSATSRSHWRNNMTFSCQYENGYSKILRDAPGWLNVIEAPGSCPFCQLSHMALALYSNSDVHLTKLVDLL